MAPEKRPSNSTQANMSVDLDELKALQQEGLTVGVVPPDGSLRTRLEIDDFIQDNDLTNLFIISLGLLMNEPWTTDRPFSYFQIASIHGRPYELWNSIGAPRLPKGTPVEKRYNPQSGYASHSSILFPTWNRAYILMFEQALYVRVADLAERYPEPFRSRYRRAARRFAMPYWDPLRPRQKMKNVHGHYFYRTGLPLVCVIPTVMVRTPERPDTLVPVRNPLYQYIFPPTRPGCGEPELAWESLNRDGVVYPHTTRHNTVRGITDTGATDSHFVNRSLDQAFSHVSDGRGVALGGKLYRILLGPKLSYAQVSSFDSHSTKNEAAAVNGSCDNTANSLEGWSNDIHAILGAGPSKTYRGHIGMPEYAAFDPIFWLHRCNVDRLTAIWQALNPDDWFTGESYPTQGASFVRYAGQLETTTTPLLPFMRPASDGSGAHVPWTSDDLRHVGELGYTYPELSRFGFGNGKGKDRSNGELAGLTRHLTEQLEWTTIGGTPPPVDTLFNSALFGRVDVFPKEITVDGEVKFVPRVIHADQKRPASGFGRWVRRTASWCRARLPFYTPPRYGHIRGLIHGGCLMDWNATFRVEKLAIPNGGSFTVFLFLGAPSRKAEANPEHWYHDRHLVGTHSFFALSSSAASGVRPTKGTALAETRRQLDFDTITLTAPLISYWRTGKTLGGQRLKSLYPPDVVPFLRENLTWIMLDQRGDTIDPTTILSFKVQVVSQVVKFQRDLAKRPLYSGQRVWTDITHEKPGGLRQNERFHHAH